MKIELTDQRKQTVRQGQADVPPGIRRSQEAYWRDLPGLLKL